MRRWRTNRPCGEGKALGGEKTTKGKRKSKKRGGRKIPTCASTSKKGNPINTVGEPTTT